MEEFTTHFKASVALSKKGEWFPVTRTCEHQCRDSAIYALHLAATSTLFTKNSAQTENPFVRDIEIGLTLNHRTGTDYPIFQELAEVFNLKVKFTEEASLFSGGKYTDVWFYGNDRTCLMAWYWAILAMRSGIVKEEGAFRERIQKSNDYDDRTWDDTSDREWSLKTWDAWVRDQTGPTSQQMIQDSVCPINWYQDYIGD